MSQSPYQPPTPPGYPYGYAPGVPVPDLGRPARVAGTMMIVMGILMALMAGCLFLASAVVNSPQLPAEQRQVITELEQKLGFGAQLFFRLGAAVVAIPAFLMVILGFLQRKGGLGVTICSIILTALVMFFIGLSAVQSVLAGAVLNACVNFVPLVLFGVQMYWLARSVSTAGPLKVFNEHHQEYQWQMAEHARQQQQAYQQMYQQQGYPPPPPPPPPGQGPDQPRQGS